MAETIRKYEFVDALRGLAILAVVLVHSSHWVSPASDLFDRICRNGAHGVQLFYVVSAFTLFNSCKARGGDGGSTWMPFFVRRFFRIAPMFLLAILIYTAWDGLSARYWAPNGIRWWYLPLTATFLHGWHPETITSVVPGGWSIAVEFTFYMLIPFLFARVKRYGSCLLLWVGALAAAWVSARVATQLLLPLYPPAQSYLVLSFARLWFPAQAPVFVVGILVFLVFRQLAVRDDRRLGLALLAVSVLLMASGLGFGTYKNLISDTSWYGVAFGFLTLGLSLYPTRILVNRFTIWTGKVSYSVYLVHFGVIRLWQAYFGEAWPVDGDRGTAIAVLLVAASSISLASATYWLVELPGIAAGKRLIERFGRRGERCAA